MNKYGSREELMEVEEMGKKVEIKYESKGGWLV